MICNRVNFLSVISVCLFQISFGQNIEVETLSLTPESSEYIENVNFYV